MIGRVSEASFPKLLWMSAGSSGVCPGMFSTGKHGPWLRSTKSEISQNASEKSTFTLIYRVSMEVFEQVLAVKVVAMDSTLKGI